ncbi:MAG: hypothetical protein QM715_02275 [Nibricoccus sp.]
MPITRSSFFTAAIRRYFYSGWAFLIPYLAVYLLYYVTKWPVNTANRNQTLEAGSQITTSLVPCLLHIYWVLHAIHVILGGFALWSALHARLSGKLEVLSEGNPQCKTSNLKWLTRIAPWALLALLFYIPGVYLEWPSDPWEHLRRINEWRILDTVGAHSFWSKSAYFIPYSLLSWCIGLRQIFWLDFYYTGVCLLLCWQYYRFSRACGLGERASMVFVIIQALLFGNNIFSFYRYYGISSSIYAQLGAIALTRIILEFASWRTSVAPQHSPYSTFLTSASHPPPRPIFWHLPSLLRLLPITFCLLPFIAFNHPQGLGIAGLGVIAIVVWRLIEWKYSVIWWLTGGALVINALFLSLYPRLAIIETYREHGYLNAWYGFNILDLTSAAGDRMLQIVSGAGLINLAAALLLFRRNHPIAWFTTIPFFALLFPCLSLPLANALSANDATVSIITFQRMLFAIPFGWALIYQWGHLGSAILCQRQLSSIIRKTLRIVGFEANTLLTSLVLATIVTITQASPGYNRSWHAVIHTSDDLKMQPMLSIAKCISSHRTHSSQLVTSYCIGAVLQSIGVSDVIYALRAISIPKPDIINPTIHKIRTIMPSDTIIIVPKAASLYTFCSQSGILSNHWPAQQTPCDYLGGTELTSEIAKHNLSTLVCAQGELYQFSALRSRP